MQTRTYHLSSIIYITSPAEGHWFGQNMRINLLLSCNVNVHLSTHALIPVNIVLLLDYIFAKHIVFDLV